MSDPESTSELIDRARCGDRPALDALFARHVAPLRRWASGRLPAWARNGTDTDDLVQDALLRTLKRIDTFEVRGAGAFEAYLQRSVLNHIKDELRCKARRGHETALDSVTADGGPSPLEIAIGREGLDRYEAALARLSEPEQAVIIGRLELGYSYEELAQSLGKTSAEAARKAASRALIRLIAEMDRLANRATT